uniref:HK3a n=1 Tax=Arundo donax TaxID=35708 RepID=A0A0A9FCZ2_ARUDO
MIFLPRHHIYRYNVLHSLLGENNWCVLILNW